MDIPRSSIAVTLLAAVAVTLVFKFWSSWRSSRASRIMRPRVKNLEELKDRSWQLVGKVSKVYLYPIKSCAGIGLASAQATQLGLSSGTVRDRSLIIMNEKGVMVTGRMIPATVKIKARVDDGILTLEFPGAPSFSILLSQVEEKNIRKTTRVWDDTVPGLDCGDEAASWLMEVLGRKCRLLYHGSIPSPRNTDLGEEYPLLRDDDNSLYADLTGYMLMTRESIGDLETRVKTHLPPQNFRPNILVEGTKGPYDEDLWEYIRIGNTLFRNVKPCSRCIFTTIDYETGKKDANMEPLRTLRSYRCVEGDNSPHFGINLGVDITGTINEGDAVYATYLQ
ncbi:mitochondrial amidoxime reducing component 2-like isoform X1 [Penaeus monodon]|uniref:mitochondrial amidoxime reducing component 2-like isoform X1 n=2 Tax=Penaeus monodon TaxID=6687 RepID=UPI0018A6EE46|nr:mitochondrial amidoxime reducing component 2-like isoform X1 [Penaeus monodon]